MRVVATICAIAVGLMPATGADRAEASTIAAKSAQANVLLTVISCSKSGKAILPEISASKTSEIRDKSINVPSSVIRATARIVTVLLSIEPGTFTVSVLQGSCFTMFDLTVLRGHQRNVVVAPTYRVFRDVLNHNSIAGTLPLKGLRASIEVCSRTTCDPASRTGVYSKELTIDGDAYYGNELTPGDWYLRVWFTNVPASVIIPVGSVSQDQKQNVNVRHDLTLEDLQTLWSRQRPCAGECTPPPRP